MYKPFRLGQWRVDPNQNALTDGTTRRLVEPRAMDVLRVLCEQPEQVVSSEFLLERCWGTAALSDNPVHKMIAQLRRVLGDSRAQPSFIATIRKRGYLIVAALGADDAALSAREAPGSPCRAQHGVRHYPVPALTTGNGLYLDCADIGEDSSFQTLASVLLDAQADGVFIFEGVSTASLARQLEYESAPVIGRLQQHGGVGLILRADRLEEMCHARTTRVPPRAHLIGVLEALAESGAVALILK